MMPKIKRKRLVVLALLAFFCCGAVTGVDWRRVGGGFLALFKSGHEPVVATGGHAPADADGSVVATRDTGSLAAGPHLAPGSSRHPARHATAAGHGHGKPDDEDLFKYGLPAAGGIPAGSFVVAQNDAPGGGGGAGPTDGAPPSDPGGPAPSGGDATSPAPGPLAGPADAGIPGGTASTTPAPAPTPGAPGGSDPGPGDSGSTPAPAPVSAVPETSPLAMMGLAALFIAVAASRRRRA